MRSRKIVIVVAVITSVFLIQSCGYRQQKARLHEITYNLRYINNAIDKFQKENKSYPDELTRILDEPSLQKLEQNGFVYTYRNKSLNDYSVIATDKKSGKHYVLTKTGSLLVKSGSEVMTPYRDLILKDDGKMYRPYRIECAIKELIRIGGIEVVDIFKEFLTTYGADRKLKQLALVGLGKIGTEEAVKAISEFEAWAENVNFSPRNFQFGWKDFAVDHYSPDLLSPLAKCNDKNGNEWAVFRWYRYGANNLWITKKLKQDIWSQPIFLDLLNISNVPYNAKYGLKIDNETFIISVDGKNISFKLGDQLLDSDRDGITDAVERILKTNPKDQDSDDDGVLDGKDGNPLTPKPKKRNDIMEIRQAVFYALFATCNSQDAIVIVEKGDIAEQEYYGYGGFILKSPKIRDGFVNVVDLKVDIKSQYDAVVEIADYEGTVAASFRKVILKNISGKWVVVDFGGVVVA
jgi:type II secretory pathway pseudopilin PulG